MPAKIYDRELILALAREFHRRYGRPPAVLDWNVAAAKGYKPERAARFYADGCWPHYGTVRYYFPEGWTAMIRLAGLTPPPPGYHYLDGGAIRKNGGNPKDRKPREQASHCKNGHEFTEANTMIVGSKRHRRCRKCDRQWQRDYYYRKRRVAVHA